MPLNTSNDNYLPPEVTLDSESINWNRLTGTAVTSINAVTNLNADMVDGKHAPEFAGRAQSSQVINLAIGWYTVAINPGDRATGLFTLTDISASANQVVLAQVSHHFGNGNNISVLHQSSYYNAPIGGLRLKSGGVYDGVMLQVYVSQATNVLQVTLTGNEQSNGWSLRSWIPDGTNPTGLNAFESCTNIAVGINLALAGAGTNLMGVWQGTQYIVLRGDGNIQSSGRVFSGGAGTGGIWVDSATQFFGSNNADNAGVYNGGNWKWLFHKDGAFVTGKLAPLADSTTALQVMQSDKTTPVMTFDTANRRVGVGTTAPSAPLHIVETGSSAAGILEQVSDNNSACTLIMRKSRGTLALPQNLQNGDSFAELIANFRANGITCLGLMLTAKYTGNGTTTDCEVDLAAGVVPTLKIYSSGAMESRSVVRDKINLSHNLVSSPILLTSLANTTIFTPNSGEEWIFSSAQFVFDSWSGTAGTKAVAQLMAGSNVTSTTTFNSTYDPFTDWLQISGAVSPAPCKRLTSTAPLRLAVTTAMVGAIGTVRVIAQLTRIK
jgi:hypothetical protein